jgi:hypothetical protein
VLALSARGASPVTLTFLTYEGSSDLLFNPDPSQLQSWQFFAPNGTLSYPATFSPGQCSLLRVVLPKAPAQISLEFELSDNETQTINLSP